LFAAVPQPFADGSVVGGSCTAGAVCTAKAVVRFVPIDGPLTPTKEMNYSYEHLKTSEIMHQSSDKTPPTNRPRLLRAEGLEAAACASVRFSSSALMGHAAGALRYG
jgi:hypothetical protein